MPRLPSTSATVSRIASSRQVSTGARATAASITSVVGVQPRSCLSPAPVRRRPARIMEESTGLRQIVHEHARDPAAEGGTLADTEVSPAYQFPVGKLGALQSTEKTPLVLIACGSFNPPTFLHLRLMEMARDWARLNTVYEVVGGYLSPVGDAYAKAGLASAPDRTAMCRAAVEDSPWIDVDAFEAEQDEYQRTVVVLDHFEHEINDVLGGIPTPEDGPRRPAHIALVAGADLIQTMSTPGVWSQEDLDKILSTYGAFVAERGGTDMQKALASIEREGMRHKMHIVPQAIHNDVSSTTVRKLIKQGLSVRYVIPDSVNHMWSSISSIGSLRSAALRSSALQAGGHHKLGVTPPIVSVAYLRIQIGRAEISMFRRIDLRLMYMRIIGQFFEVTTCRVFVTVIGFRRGLSRHGATLLDCTSS